MSLRLVSKSVWENPGNRGRRLRKFHSAIVWQLRKRLLRSTRVMHLANGTRFRAYPDCVISSALIYSDWPEFYELQFVRRVLKPTEAIIDVGANVGHVSLLLSDIAGAERVFAFEPTPVSFHRLLENWALNGWVTTNLFQVAVGARSGVVRIPDTASPETKNSVKAMGDSPSVEINLIALDDIRDRWRGYRIGLLKIDVEGYEQEVFAGAQRLLADDRPKVVMFESLAGRVEEKVSAILRAARYEIFQLDEEGNPDFSLCSAQNLFAVPAEERDSLLKCVGS